MPTEFKTTEDNLRFCLALPNNQLATISFNSRVVNFWDVKTGESLGFLDALTTVYCLALSPDGHLAIGQYHGVTIWDIQTKQKINTLEAEGLFSQIFLLPRRHLMAVSNSSIITWDHNNRSQLCGRAFNRPQLLGNEWIVTIQDLKNIYLQNILDEKIKSKVEKFAKDITALTIMPDGKLMIGFDSFIGIYEFNKDQCKLALIKSYKTKFHSCSLLAFPDGKHFLSGDSIGHVVLWNVDDPHWIESKKVSFGCELLLQPDGHVICYQKYGSKFVYFEYDQLNKYYAHVSVVADQVKKELAAVTSLDYDVMKIVTQYDAADRVRLGLFKPAAKPVENVLGGNVSIAPAYSL